MSQGWIKLHRKLIDWGWFKNPDIAHLFVYLILKANHKDGSWQGIQVKKGQLLTGRKRLSEETGLSEQKIRTCLSRLKSTSDITIESTSKYSLITVCNYKTYQSDNATPNHNINQNSNQQLTSTQPALNQHLTTNKNVNNNKNEKEVLGFTLQQVENAGFRAGVSDDECKIFFDHYNSQGWLKGNGLPITDLVSQITNWRNNGHKFPDKPKPKSPEGKQMLQQWEDRFGQFIRTGDIEHIKSDQGQNLGNPKFYAWAVSQRAELKEIK